MYLSLYCKGSKRLLKVCVLEGAGDRTETAIFWPPLLWPLCLSRSPGLLNRRPRGPLCWLICYIFSASALDPNSSEPQGFFGLMWLSLPHLAYNSVRSLTGTVLTSVLTELCNSSMPTQSPTRSLKSHVGSSSSGNNCHAVQRSLSPGVSVYECTMGIFYLVPFHQPISTHTISSHNCH